MGCWEHVSQVAKGIYHLQLVRSNLDFPLWSTLQGACSSLAPCTSVIRVLCQALEPLHFLCTQCLQLSQKMLLLPTPVDMETHLNSAGGPGPYHRSWPSSFLHLLSPFSSTASFQVKSLLIHSSRKLCRYLSKMAVFFAFNIYSEYSHTFTGMDLLSEKGVV